VFEPGQFLTWTFEIGGEVVNRCYTLASSALRPYRACITVKRVPKGLVSNWLHDHLAPGREVHAIGPLGSFSPARHPAQKYLFL
jgi:ferredoxin-NADP reductase